MEKQRDKFAKRQQRKTEKAAGGHQVDDMGEPVGDLSEPGDLAESQEPQEELGQLPGA